MGKTLSKISIVDVMVVIAILMILSAIILPHFAQSYTRLTPYQRAHGNASAVSTP